MLHTEKIIFFEVFETQFPPRDPELGNVVESNYVLIVAWVSTDLIGIADSRNKEADVRVEKYSKCCILKIIFFLGFGDTFPPKGPKQGNLIESHYVLIVAWVSTDLIGITISRN